MIDRRQYFTATELILRSALMFVFILFVINGLNLSFLSRFGFIPVLLIATLLKVYWLSALSGCILEVISGEEIVFKFRRLHPNAMQLWPGFLIAFAVLRLVDFLTFVLFPKLFIWRPVYFTFLEVLTVYLLARWTMMKKYLKPLGLPRRRSKITPAFLSVMVLVYGIQLVLGGITDLVHFGGIYWHNIFAFMQSYLQVFEFTFFAFYVLDLYPEIQVKFNHPREIYLINPMAAAVVHSLGFRIFVPWNPPYFVVLKALTPKTYQFREFNQVIWHDRFYKKDVLVCITCFTTNCYEAYKIAKEFKKRGSKVVIGGPHVTFLPYETYAFCDSVIIGQAEGVWKEVLRDYENGTLKPQYMGAATEADYGQVHQELLNSPPNVIKDFMETNRGCKFRCHFCSVPTLSGGQIRLSSINDITDLIKRIKPHNPNIKFIDNNIYSDPGYAKELFTALKPMHIKWRSACTIDIAKNEETLKLARESGCTGMFFGYEISGGSFEKTQGGKFTMAKKYMEYTQTIKKSGIHISGAFIFGFDSDSLKSFFQLWKFCFSIMPAVSHVAMLTPLPGTGVYKDMLAQERLINLNWRSYNFNGLVARHPHLNPTLMFFLFPLLRIFFLLTTSYSGYTVLLILLLPIQYWMGYTFFK